MIQLIRAAVAFRLRYETERLINSEARKEALSTCTISVEIFSFGRTVIAEMKRKPSKYACYPFDSDGTHFADSNGSEVSS